MPSFIPCRFLIVPAEQSLLLVGKATHEQKVGWLRTSLLKNQDWATKHGAKYMIVAAESTDHVVCGKIAKLRNVSRHVREFNDVRTEQGEDWPYLHFACDLTETEQLFVVEDPGKIGLTLPALCHFLGDIARREVMIHGYAIRVQPIAEERTFWDLMGENHVYKVTLQLRSPNMLGMSACARRFLNQLRDETNNVETKITLENPRGALRCDRSTLVGSMVEYAAEGGGEWEIQHVPSGSPPAGQAPRQRKKPRKKKTRSWEQPLRADVDTEGVPLGPELAEKILQKFRRKE